MVAAIGLGVSLFLLIYPYLIYPHLLKLLPKARVPGAQPLENQRFALLFCAYDEAGNLPDTLADLRALKRLWPGLEIHAFDDFSRDGTGPLLENASDILTPHHATRRTGKAAGIVQMLAKTRADVVLFMDANTRIDVASMLNFRSYFADATIGAVAATVTLPNGTESATAGVGAAFWRLEERIKALESATGSTVGCDGALWGIRRHLYPKFAHYLADDFRPSMEPVFRGLRVVSAPDIRATEPAAAETGGEFARKIRIACGAWHAHDDMNLLVARLGWKHRFKYASHKLIRWFSFVWLVAAAGFAAALAWQTGLFWFFAWVALASGLAAFRGIGPFGKGLEIVLAMLATFLGILKAVRGREQAVWETVRS